MTVTATTTEPVIFRHVSRDLWRSADSRFDVIDTHLGYYVAFDADAGRVFRSKSWHECAEWCRKRAGA